MERSSRNLMERGKIKILTFVKRSMQLIDSKMFRKIKPVSVKRRLRTADCRLRTRDKMQTVCKMQTAD